MADNEKIVVYIAPVFGRFIICENDDAKRFGRPLIRLTYDPATWEVSAEVVNG